MTGVWNGPVPDTDFDAANAQPWVNDLIRQRQQDYHRGRPLYQCLPNGPEADRSAGWKRVLQTPTAIAILNEDLTYRVIHMDGRDLEANAAPSWMGYSVGRWDGDTLIVDSNGFNDKTWLSRYGRPHTEALRVTGAIPAHGLRPPAGGGRLHRSESVREALGLHGAMALAADAEMLESVCERSSDQWVGSLLGCGKRGADRYPGDAGAVRRRLQRHVLTNKRTIEVSLSGGQLVAKIIGAAAIDGGEMRPLVPRSQTLFEGLGIGYQFIVDDKGVATDLVEIHQFGSVAVPRQR